MLEVEGQGLHGLHGSQWVKVELQTPKTKAAMQIIVKKVAAIDGYIKNWICLTKLSRIYLFFLNHDLIALLNVLFQKFDRCETMNVIKEARKGFSLQYCLWN